MNSRIYLTREKHFLQISDEFLANKILTDYKDIIDLIAGSPNEIYYHTGHPRIPTQGDKLYTTNFHAETHQFHKIDEIKFFLEEKFLNNYVIPYQISRHDDRIILRVIIIPIEYDIIDVRDKKRKIRSSKIDKILKN